MNRPEIIETVAPLIDAFQKAGIEYYICGSVAGSLYGMARATLDVDLVAAVHPEQISSLENLLMPHYYFDPTSAVQSIRKNMSFNLVHLETMLKVDVFPLKSALFSSSALKRRRKDTFGDDPVAQEFFFATAEDTIIAKLDWYRSGGGVSEKQWLDVLGILKVQKAALDGEYLRSSCTSMGLVDLLDKALIDAGILKNG